MKLSNEAWPIYEIWNILYCAEVWISKTWKQVILIHIWIILRICLSDVDLEGQSMCYIDSLWYTGSTPMTFIQASCRINVFLGITAPRHYMRLLQLMRLVQSSYQCHFYFSPEFPSTRVTFSLIVGAFNSKILYWRLGTDMSSKLWMGAGKIQAFDKEKKDKRLASQRNVALEPLWPRIEQDPRSRIAGDQSPQFWKADKVIFFNDAFFCAQDIIRLLYSKADMTCGLDFHSEPDEKVRPTFHQTPISNWPTAKLYTYLCFQNLTCSRCIHISSPMASFNPLRRWSQPGHSSIAYHLVW